MRICFIVNPAAGRGRASRVWKALEPLLRGRAGIEVRYTTGPGEATRLARAAAEAGYPRVAAVGGDGTQFEVVNGIMGTAAALAVIPCGTANDFIRTAGIPAEPREALALALEGAPRPIDVGLLDGRCHFVNIAGAGFDAEVAARVNRWPKFFGGTIPYLAGILGTLWRYRPAPMRIEVDGRRLAQRVLMVAVGNTQYYGGGLRIVPDARDDDGYFDICVVGDVGRLETLRTVPRVYGGRHVTHPKVTMLRGRRVRIEADRPVALHADGELVGTLPATFDLLPGALRVVTLPR